MRLFRASQLGMGPLAQLLKFKLIKSLNLGYFSLNFHFSNSFPTKAQNHFKTLGITNYYLVDYFQSQLGQWLVLQVTTSKLMIFTFFILNTFNSILLGQNCIHNWNTPLKSLFLIIKQVVHKSSIEIHTWVPFTPNSFIKYHHHNFNSI